MLEYFLSPVKADFLPTDGGRVVRPLRPPWLRACGWRQGATRRSHSPGNFWVLHLVLHLGMKYPECDMMLFAMHCISHLGTLNVVTIIKYAIKLLRKCTPQQKRKIIRKFTQKLMIIINAQNTHKKTKCEHWYLNRIHVALVEHSALARYNIAAVIIYRVVQKNGTPVLILR